VTPKSSSAARIAASLLVTLRRGRTLAVMLCLPPEKRHSGDGDTGLAALLAAGRVRRIVCSFPRQSDSWVFDGLYRSGRITDAHLRTALATWFAKDTDDCAQHLRMLPAGPWREQTLALATELTLADLCDGYVATGPLTSLHAATAIAREDSDVIVLSKRALLRLQKEDAALFSLLMMNIARELARRLRLTDDILLRLMRNPDSG